MEMHANRFYEVNLTQNSKMSSSEEVEFSDKNSDESPLSSSPECEIEHESDGAFASPSASEDEDAAAVFAEEPLADAEWTAQYEREGKDKAVSYTHLTLPTKA